MNINQQQYDQVTFVQIKNRDNIYDPWGNKFIASVKREHDFNCGEFIAGKIYTVNKLYYRQFNIEESELKSLALSAWCDPLLHQVSINDVGIIGDLNNNLNGDSKTDNYQSLIIIGKHPGVTDDEGKVAEITARDFFSLAHFQDDNQQYSQTILTNKFLFLKNRIDLLKLRQWGEEFLANRLINYIIVAQYPFDDIQQQLTKIANRSFVPTFTTQPTQFLQKIERFEHILEFTKNRDLAFDDTELKSILGYYQRGDIQAKRKKFFAISGDSAGNSASDSTVIGPSELEIEIFAQTWSEHCKHKEFNAIIEYHNLDCNQKITINSLFKTYIQSATNLITERLKHATTIVEKKRERNGSHLSPSSRINRPSRPSWPSWPRKVFADNAGLVQVDAQHYLAFKVETHNTPSALDPYGGAITGILGVNRDAVATGVGGGKAILNTNVLCFAPPNYQQPLLPGQLPPRRIMEGVVEGIADGGNKMGIPTVNGSIFFDDRFAGKPLVFCGTAAIMPTQICRQGMSEAIDSAEKIIDNGDLIVMLGGRVGKDGIHGATISSMSLNEDSEHNSSSVQIGSPFTQKLLFDFLEEAVQQGLVKACTDNGAGGLSSSIGELALITNGAVVELHQVPLKYHGLAPWEIFVSESQERMTLAVSESAWEQLKKLSLNMNVEATNIGRFTNSGYLEINYFSEKVAYLELDFLHHGLPQKKLFAEWQTPIGKNEGNPCDNYHYFNNIEYNKIALQLISSLNICSREEIIRRYDHEVQGRSILKPLMNHLPPHAPQDAGVLRLNLDNESYRGLAVANGMAPQYVDYDPYHSSAGAFDEVIRQIIAVGGRIPSDKPESLASEDSVWTINDNFCMPNAVYDPEKNPDGKRKLGQLVEMCRALYDISTYYNIPITSGKDSMKNDLVVGENKISIPPTVLYSAISIIPDVRRTISSEFKNSGDLIYLIGNTYNELCGSEFFKILKLDCFQVPSQVPKVRKELARPLYLKMMQAHDMGLLESAHDLSQGGLWVALAEATFNSNNGVGNGAGAGTGALGADIEIVERDMPPWLYLFSESHSRFLVSIKPQRQKQFEQIWKTNGSENESENENKSEVTNVTLLGTVTDRKAITLKFNKQIIIDLNIDQIYHEWENGLKQYLH
ncbi:MAG: phosphoribosylformylglycinamidine synthase [Oligoflexia bacterium]|nr:phosphoribosylformylglycinamidine synthase [Oligoflexia bacterium]